MFQFCLYVFLLLRAIGDVWSIYLGDNILRLEWPDTLFETPVPSIFIGDILLSKALGSTSVPRKIL